MFSLKGRVGIVTGAAARRGIGRATALALAKQGVKVVMCDIDSEGIYELEKKIRAAGGESIAVQADVSDSKKVQKVVDLTLGKYERVDILVNNAAINQPITVVDMSEEDWAQVLNVNLKSVFLFCRAVLPSMIEHGYGRIINLSSVAGKTGCISYGGAHYSASKAGILAFSKHLVREVSPFGITVNSIVPGTIATDIRGGLESKERQKEISKNIPCRRFGRTNEVASLICFLASEEAGYITGEDIDINGGVYMD